MGWGRKAKRLDGALSQQRDAASALVESSERFAQARGDYASSLNGTPAIDDVPSDWLDFTKASTNGPLAQGAALPGGYAGIAVSAVSGDAMSRHCDGLNVR